MHSLRLKELKEEVTELAWRQNFQNDVCKGTVENPDDFSLADHKMVNDDR